MTHMNDMDEGWVPVTPGGTVCEWLAAPTKVEAIGKLLKDAAHMPYRNWGEFETRGYTVEQFTSPEDK